MLAVMPASILSGLQVLALMPKRRGAEFWLTAAGTAGSYPITISASNSAGTTQQSFTLTVQPGAVDDSATVTEDSGANTIEDLSHRLSITLNHEVEVLEHQFARNNVSWIAGEARFLDAHSVEVRTVLTSM